MLIRINQHGSTWITDECKTRLVVLSRHGYRVSAPEPPLPIKWRMMDQTYTRRYMYRFRRFRLGYK